MSGETEQQVSGWTVDTLQGHLETILDERTRHVDERHAALLELLREYDRRYETRFAALDKDADETDKRQEQRFIAQQEAIQAALLAQKEAVNAALVAADRAVVKAETASEKRFDAVNEFRATLADQATTLMPRLEAESRMQAHADKLDSLATNSRDTSDRIREEHRRDITDIRDEFHKATALINQSLATTQGRGSGYSQSWTVIVAAVGVLLGVGSFIFALIK